MDEADDQSPEKLLGTALGNGDELAGLRAIGQLRAQLDEREERLVVSARVRRRTWSEIGDAIGTTRQGAYNRFGELAKRELGVEPGPPDELKPGDIVDNAPGANGARLVAGGPAEFGHVVGVCRCGLYHPR